MFEKEMEIAQPEAAVNPEIELNQEQEVESSIEQEVDEQINSDLEEFESLKRELSGLPSEQIELVKSITNKEDRQKAIELAKKQRADKDRLHLELGNTKKELERMNSFLQQIENQKLSQESNDILPEDSYLTEQERLLKNKIIQLENQVKLGEQQRLNAENFEIISQFKESKPDFEELEQDIGLAIDILNRKKGIAYTTKARQDRLEEAYKLAKSLNYSDKTEAELERLKQQEELRKQKIEESKKLKKFSRNSPSVPQKLTPDEIVAKIWSNDYAA